MKLIGNKDIISKNPLQNLLLDKLTILFDNSVEYILYHEFPFQKGETKAENLSPDYFLISQDYGIFYFCIYNDDVDINDFFEFMDNVYESIRSKVSKLSQLRKGRYLKYEIHPVAILQKLIERDDIIIATIDDISKVLKHKEKIDEEDYRLIQSCIDGTCSLSVKKDRIFTHRAANRTKAQILNDIQNHIANFDIEQKQLSLVDYDGPQRIRGLAGSGKTIVLAHKVAKFHAEHPDLKILYTYYTKSLGETVRTLIRKAYKNYSSDDPDWDKIDILHGWGSSYIPGVYSTACSLSNSRCLTFSECRGQSKQPFAYACETLLKNKEQIPEIYDLIVIDEGQDFVPEFYQLCYSLSNGKRICWAYDDFQNIFETEIQDEHRTFGFDEKQNPYVDFSSGNPLQDVVLKKCYRTPRVILICAFALGLGIYNEKVLQGLENKKYWEGLGFFIEKGDCTVGSEMVVSRPLENTPSYSNEYFNENSFKLVKCGSFNGECKFIADEIDKLLKNDYLLCSDISVICVDQANIATYFSSISQRLFEHGIDTFNHLNAASDNTSYFRDNHITLSSVNKAKGNECGVVFVCGVDSIFRNPNNVMYRDRLFTAMTRTKGWLYLSGIGDNMNFITEEINKLKENQFKLKFIQPDPENTKIIKSQSRESINTEQQIAELLKRLKALGNDEDSIKRMVDGLLNRDYDKK